MSPNIKYGPKQARALLGQINHQKPQVLQPPTEEYLENIEHNKDLRKECMDILKGVQSHEYAWVFANPVYQVDWDIEDYFDVIKNPMDLETIQIRIE